MGNVLWQDLRIAVRQHVRLPGFAATVVGTLALTIGATVAVFSVVNSMLVRGLPFVSPERLVWVASVRPDNPNAPFTLPEFLDYRGQTRTLSGLAAYATWTASLAGDGVTERLTGARLSANAFDVLGVTPAAGRLLNDSDDRPDAPQVVVLSYRVWQQKYGGSLDVVGKAVRINGESFVVVGVLPAQFPLPLLDIDIVTPLVPDRDPLRNVRGSVNFLRFVGRLNWSVDRAQAQAELTTICRALRQRFPVEYARKDAMRVVPLQDCLVGDYRQPMGILLAAVLVVLATALANLVALVLVRANGRRAELTLRIALGASRLQLARQLAVEASLLALAGGSLGWLLAAQAIAAARLWAPPAVPRMGEVSLDGMSALFVAAVTGLATLLLTIAPLATIASTRAGDALRMTSRGAIGDRWNQRVRRMLVVSEIAAALVLLLATTLLVQNLQHLQEVQLGFRPDGVFQARVSIPPTYRSPDDVARFYERLSDRLAAAPGVARVGVISVAPLSGLLLTVPFSVVGQATLPRDRPSANLRAISAGYADAAGTRLLQGRLFSERDRSDTPPVALVSAALADRFLAGNAIGRHLQIADNNAGPRTIDVVGVLEDVRQAALDLPPALDIYIPFRQIHPDSVAGFRNNQFWLVKIGAQQAGTQQAGTQQAGTQQTRAYSDPAAFRETFLTHLRAVDPDAAVSSAGTGTMRQYLDAWLGPRRFNLALFGAFALTAILLAVSGLYGLVAYTVSQRTPEIGLRMAIGATQRDVRRMILRQAAGLGLTGAAVGLCIAATVGPLTAGLIPDVRISATTIVATAALVIGIVLTAAWFPARRAARIEPTVALKGPA